ncbi:Na+/H+ antiporter subunit D [Aquibium oceanicum]|uniref:Na+/H+ antiporter subunit D n=1 Tax=Aquibium oceanicum TaxID=1670800 RepID=A0A1L3SQ12_9HYPH|nr:Na+/H+ antiporter subunit D [Aquibium oceanicum]APH71506.1 Na+/H+ antiporter subunit D [Aquibium oceanicum]
MAVVGATSIDTAAAHIAGATALADWLVIAPVALPILGGALLLMVRHRTRVHAVLAFLFLFASFLSAAFLLARVVSEGPLVMTMGRWLPPFGITFNADALGATFATAASFVATAAAVFALRDINVTGRRYGFYSFLLLMVAGVNGAFLTGDIFNLYVWFEVFVISSFGLLILGSERRQIDGATKYAVLNLVATTVFLITTGILYGTFGTLNMADIARKADGLRETGPLMTIATLYLLAFGMKAAAFPLNYWLPASYHTPRIVTSALFGGLLTKVGIYALLRTMMTLFPVERGVLSGLIGWIAIATMILGILGALAQSDVRRIIGFVVISGIGVMLAGLALGTPLGVTGTILYAVHSILVMTALYLLAGLMHEAGGSYSLHHTAGLYRSHPLLAAMALLLVLAAAGLPPLSGLWPKVMLVRASIENGSWWMASAILVSSILTVIALGRVFALSFWRMEAGEAAERADTEGAISPAAGYGVLAALIVPAIAIGVYPEPFLRLAAAAAAGLADPASYLDAVFPAGGGS